MKKTFNIEELSNLADICAEVINLYQYQNLSLDKVAHLTGLTKFTVRQILLDNNIQLRKH